MLSPLSTRKASNALKLPPCPFIADFGSDIPSSLWTHSAIPSRPQRTMVFNMGTSRCLFSITCCLMYDCGGRHLCYLYKHISSFLSPAMIIILQMILESFTDFLILVEWFVYKTTERCDFTTIIFYLCWANQHAWHTHNAFHIE